MEKVIELDSPQGMKELKIDTDIYVPMVTYATDPQNKKTNPIKNFEKE